jgi:peptidoglycan hydrolase CwlO-like protein
MQESRRSLLMTFIGSASVLTLTPILSALQAPGVHPSPPQPKPSPNTPNSNVPSGLNGPPVTTDSKTGGRQNQEELRSDVSRLYEMVSELKEQIDHTDANSTLSLSVVKKAQQIEKLAKQIKELAKG